MGCNVLMEHLKNSVEKTSRWSYAIFSFASLWLDNLFRRRTKGKGRRNEVLSSIFLARPVKATI